MLCIDNLKINFDKQFIHLFEGVYCYKNTNKIVYNSQYNKIIGHHDLIKNHFILYTDIWWEISSYYNIKCILIPYMDFPTIRITNKIIKKYIGVDCIVI